MDRLQRGDERVSGPTWPAWGALWLLCAASMWLVPCNASADATDATDGPINAMDDATGAISDAIDGTRDASPPSDATPSGVADPIEPDGARRFALVIGANDGGADRVRLRYAGDDAVAFADVMARYGGVDPTRLIMVTDPDRAAVDAAFAALHARVGDEAGAGRVEVLVFYSGHADERGLLLGGERLGYPELRGHIDAVPADVRIAIVDACASGALIRAKGGQRRPPFLIDRASRVTGSAYLASASADEAAQESDRLQASFFSHALMTGLRGAADVSEDGVVTLNEAYQFAFRETLARTEGTRLGAQHASYDMQLVGSGDVVLTDLRATSAGVVLAPTLAGRVFVRDARGRLVAELDKAVGQAIRLGLAPGRYGVRLDPDEGPMLYGAVELAAGATALLGRDGLSPVEGEVTVARGGTVPRRSAGFSLLPSVSTDGGGAHRDFSFNVLGRTYSVGVLELGLVMNRVTADAEGVRLALGMDLVGGNVDGVAGALGYSGVGGDLDGAQFALGAAAVEGNVSGAQFALGVVRAQGDVEGMQNALGVASARDMRGFQGAAVASAERVDGAQFGLVATSDDVDGMQAGLIASADRVQGFQLGLLTLADEVDGMQMGLITVADELDGVAFALFPIVGNGLKEVELFATELALANLGMRLGSPAFHNIWSVGVNTLDGAERLTWAFGFGSHFTLGRFMWLDVDLLGQGLWSEFDVDRIPFVIGTLRVLLGAQIDTHFAVYGGGGWSVSADEREFEFGFDAAYEHEVDGGVWVRQWPTIIAGLRF